MKREGVVCQTLQLTAFSRKKWAVPLRYLAQPEGPAAVAAAAAVGHQGEPPSKKGMSKQKY